MNDLIRYRHQKIIFEPLRIKTIRVDFPGNTTYNTQAKY